MALETKTNGRKSEKNYPTLVVGGKTYNRREVCYQIKKAANLPGLVFPQKQADGVTFFLSDKGEGNELVAYLSNGELTHIDGKPIALKQWKNGSSNRVNTRPYQKLCAKFVTDDDYAEDEVRDFVNFADSQQPKEAECVMGISTGCSQVLVMPGNDDRMVTIPMTEETMEHTRIQFHASQRQNRRNERQSVQQIERNEEIEFAIQDSVGCDKRIGTKRMVLPDAEIPGFVSTKKDKKFVFDASGNHVKNTYDEPETCIIAGRLSLSEDADKEFKNIVSDANTEYEAYPGKSEEFSVTYNTNAPNDAEVEVFDSEDYKTVMAKRDVHRKKNANENIAGKHVETSKPKQREFNPREIVKYVKDVVKTAKYNALFETNKAMQYADKHYLLAEDSEEYAYTNPAYESYEKLAKSLSRVDERTLCLIEELMDENEFRGTEKKLVREARKKSKVSGDIETAKKFIDENNLNETRDKYDGAYNDNNGKEQSKKELDALLKMELGQLEVLVALHHAEKWTDTRTLLAESRLKNSGRTIPAIQPSTN